MIMPVLIFVESEFPYKACNDDFSEHYEYREHLFLRPNPIRPIPLMSHIQTLMLLHEIPRLTVVILKTRIHERRLDEILENFHVHDPVHSSFFGHALSAGGE